MNWPGSSRSSLVSRDEDNSNNSPSRELPNGERQPPMQSREVVTRGRDGLQAGANKNQNDQ